MLKVIVVLFLALTVGVGALATFFVPKRFHHQIHQVLIPGMSKDSLKTYRKLKRSVHETVVQTDKFLTTVTSVSGLIPQDYQVLIKIQSKATKSEVEARIYSEFNDGLELHVDFNDFNNEDPDDGLAIKKAHIVFETPMKALFVDKKKRTQFLLNKTLMTVTVKEVAGIWSVDGGLKESSSGRIDDLTWVLGIESLITDSFKLHSKLNARSLEFSFANNKGRYKDIEQTLVFDSFSKAGFLENYESLNALTAASDTSPMGYKLLTMIPLVKDLLIFPFEITQYARQVHRDGTGTLDFKISIKDIELYGLNEAVQIDLNASFPKIMAESQMISSLAGIYARTYKERFYPAELNSPDTVNDYAEMSKLRALAEVQLKAAFETFLRQGVSGKKIIDRVLADAVVRKILTYKDGIYSIHASYGSNSFRLGGKEHQLEDWRSVLPAQEVGAYLLANGFVQLGKL